MKPSNSNTRLPFSQAKGDISFTSLGAGSDVFSPNQDVISCEESSIAQSPTLPNYSRISQKYPAFNISGILILGLQQLFDLIKVENDIIGGKTFVIKCSYCEIYNDLVYDLLTSKEFGEVLSVSEDSKVSTAWLTKNRQKTFMLKELKNSPFILMRNA